MGGARGAAHEHAAGRLRARDRAGRGGFADQRALPVAVSVVLYHAPGCSLCEEARGIVASLRSELDFDYAEVDISGDPSLEERFRALLPVVEIDREQVFVFDVAPGALRRELLSRTQSQAFRVRFS